MAARRLRRSWRFLLRLQRLAAYSVSGVALLASVSCRSQQRAVLLPVLRWQAARQPYAFAGFKQVCGQRQKTKQMNDPKIEIF
jgi:hypothetical protein